jgi:hypothetical protein
MAEPTAPPLRRLEAFAIRIDGRGQWPDPNGTVVFASVAFETAAA